MAGQRQLTENMLLDIGKAYEDMLSTQNISLMDSLCEKEVTLHADGISLQKNITGLEDVKAYQATYNHHYTYKHLPLAQAASQVDGVVFLLNEDKDVTPKLEAFKHLSEEKKEAMTHEATSSVVAMWMLKACDSGKVSDIFFNRQLSRDEIGRKLKTTPNLALQEFDAEGYADSKDPTTPSPELQKKMQDAGVAFNKIWATGDTSLADEIMVKDVRMHGLTFGDTKIGREAFKSMIKGLFQNWKVEHNKAIEADSNHGKKAFVYWEAQGVMTQQNERDSLSGMNALVFTEEGLIREVLGFRKLMQYERKQMLRDEYL